MQQSRTSHLTANIKRTNSQNSPLPDLLKYQTQSSTLNKSKEDLFPTIRMIPKQLNEVERCYWSAAKLANLPISQDLKILEKQQFQQIKKVLEGKIAQKRKQALDMKTQESRMKWTIQRQIKHRQKQDEEKRVKQEIEFYRTERWKSMDKGSSAYKEKSSNNQQTNLKDNPEQKKITTRKRSKKNLEELKNNQHFKGEIEQLKGQLRQQCVNVIQREDALNSILISFKNKH